MSIHENLLQRLRSQCHDRPWKRLLLRESSTVCLVAQTEDPPADPEKANDDLVVPATGAEKAYERKV